PAGSGRDARPFAEVPAPLLAVRGAGTGWIGQGWLTGRRKVVSWKSELLDTGPVLARARITYEFGGGQNYVVEITVPAGQPVALEPAAPHLHPAGLGPGPRPGRPLLPQPRQP